MKVDGEPWKYLSVEDPNGRHMLNIRVRGRLRRQGLTELAFESAEPTFDELTPDEFFERFPEGQYDIEGVTVDGEELESETEITHLAASSTSATVAASSSADNAVLAALRKIIADTMPM